MNLSSEGDAHFAQKPLVVRTLVVLDKSKVDSAFLERGYFYSVRMVPVQKMLLHKPSLEEVAEGKRDYFSDSVGRQNQKAKAKDRDSLI